MKTMETKKLAYIPNADVGDIVDICSYLYWEITSINWHSTGNKNYIRTEQPWNLIQTYVSSHNNSNFWKLWHMMLFFASDIDLSKYE